MKTEQKNIIDNLDLPNYIRGVRKFLWLNFDPDYELAIKFFNELYDNIASARFGLIQGDKKYHDNILNNESGEKGQYWLRFQFLKSSINWYNSSPDILYQVLWFGYALYRNAGIKNVKKNGIINSVDSPENYRILLKRCKWKMIKDILEEDETEDTILLLSKINEFKETDIQKTVIEWANSLKHHGNFEIEELYVPIPTMQAGIYQTIFAKPTVVKIDEITSTLTEYHISFCKLLKYTFDFFDFETFGKLVMHPHNSEKLYKKIIIK